jgi:hypothetical protein
MTDRHKENLITLHSKKERERKERKKERMNASVQCRNIL